MRDLQGAYMGLAEIKRATDEQRHNTISREQVERILDDGLPAIKQALLDLFGKIKLSLKPEQRADYDIAYNNALPEYNRKLSEIVAELNSILDPKND